MKKLYIMKNKKKSQNIFEYLMNIYRFRMWTISEERPQSCRAGDKGGAGGHVVYRN